MLERTSHGLPKAGLSATVAAVEVRSCLSIAVSAAAVKSSPTWYVDIATIDRARILRGWISIAHRARARISR